MKNIAASLAGAAIVMLVLAQASGAHEWPLGSGEVAITSSPRPTPVATVSRGPVPPPTPSLPTTTTFGAIGALERNHSTQVSALNAYLTDHDPAVQTRAVLALGRLGNQEALAELTTILEDRRRA